MRCAAVIPAHDEARTVGEVVRALKSSPMIDEVIVVSDGSKDRTVEAARAAGADQVIELAENVGKGGALARGVAATSAEVLFFCDADMLGVTPETIEGLLGPVLDGKLAMQTGLRDRGPIINSLVAHLPLIGGERALRREVFEGVPERFMRGYGSEIALNFFCRVNGLPYVSRPSVGVMHVKKITKRGFFKGLAAYVRMVTQLVVAFIRLESSRKAFKHHGHR